MKALSPGINDPVTAAHAVGHMADLLVHLTGRGLGPQLHHDRAGVARVVTLDRDFRYYLDLACGQIRRYGERELTVLAVLLRMLRDVGLACQGDDQRREIRRQVDLLFAGLPDLLPADVAGVRHVAAQVESALRLEMESAYTDRSGETRSL